MHIFKQGPGADNGGNDERKKDLLDLFSAPFTYCSEQEKRILNVPGAKTLSYY